MAKIKNLIKSFVRKLEVNDDGVADEDDFKSIVYYIINFIDPNVSKLRTKNFIKMKKIV